MKSLLAPIVIAALAFPAAAQLKVSVQATNNAGVAIDRANNTRSVQTHAANKPFASYSRAFIYDQNPYAYLMSYVYPPFNIPNGPTYNRVMLMASAFARKKSGHKSLHTTGNKLGNPGTQKFQISLSSANATRVKIDWLAFGNIYDASTASAKFTIGNTKKSWTWTSGFKRDNGSLTVNVKGTTVINVELTGTCKPGTGKGGNTFYDGFYGYLNFNFLEVRNGSFKTFGVGCSQGKIGAKGQPVKGSFFDITYTGGKPNKTCALLLGYSKDFHTFIKLPLNLSYMGAKGCFLNVGFNFPWYRKTDASGNASARLYLSPWLSGTYYCQWLIWDPKNPGGGLSLSKGAEVKF